jgi:hypothetical protein
VAIAGREAVPVFETPVLVPEEVLVPGEVLALEALEAQLLHCAPEVPELAALSGGWHGLSSPSHDQLNSVSLSKLMATGWE